MKSRTHYALRALRLALEEMGVGRHDACEFAHDDAAYVLGALSPEDRLAFERHLPTCPECARVGAGAGRAPRAAGPAAGRDRRAATSSRAGARHLAAGAGASRYAGPSAVAPGSGRAGRRRGAVASARSASARDRRSRADAARRAAHTAATPRPPRRPLDADDRRRRRADLRLALADPGRVGHPPRPDLQLRRTATTTTTRAGRRTRCSPHPRRLGRAGRHLEGRPRQDHAPDRRHRADRDEITSVEVRTSDGRARPRAHAERLEEPVPERCPSARPARPGAGAARPASPSRRCARMTAGSWAITVTGTSWPACWPLT